MSTKVVGDDRGGLGPGEQRATRSRGGSGVRAGRRGVPGARPAAARRRDQGDSERCRTTGASSTGWCGTWSWTACCSPRSTRSSTSRPSRCWIVASRAECPRSCPAYSRHRCCTWRPSGGAPALGGLRAVRRLAAAGRARLPQQAFRGHLGADRGVVARGDPGRCGARPATGAGLALEGSGVAAFAILKAGVGVRSGRPRTSGAVPGLRRRRLAPRRGSSHACDRCCRNRWCAHHSGRVRGRPGRQAGAAHAHVPAAEPGRIGGAGNDRGRESFLGLPAAGGQLGRRQPARPAESAEAQADAET